MIFIAVCIDVEKKFFNCIISRRNNIFFIFLSNIVATVDELYSK